MLPWVDSSPCLRDWLTAKNRPQWLRAVPGVRTSFLDDLVIEQSTRDLVGAIGFKLMYNQMSLWPRIGYLVPQASSLFKDHALQQWIISNHVMILHTRRRNHLKALVSHRLAVQSGRFHSRDPEVSCRSVVVPVRGLKARLGRIEAAERAACRAIRGLSDSSTSFTKTTWATHGTKRIPTCALPSARFCLKADCPHHLAR